MEDFSKNITRCNLRSHGQILQARSQILEYQLVSRKQVCAHLINQFQVSFVLLQVTKSLCCDFLLQTECMYHLLLDPYNN